MRTLAFVTQQGGSGKSTLSASLAVAAQGTRELVFLIDMDPQKSLATWARNRSDDNLGVQAITPSQLPAVLGTLAESHVSLVIIDTPASSSATSEAAMGAADLVVIPVRPTVGDIWSNEVAWRRARELQKECAFVLNQCPIVHGSRRLREGVTAIEAMGSIVQPIISARVEYQEAILRGLGPTEVNPTGAAAEETRHLWQALRRRLARAKLNQLAARRAA